MELIHETFLGLPPADGDAGVLVLPLPLDITASWGRGTAGGPRAILDASRHIELYDEELEVELHEAAGRIATHPAPELPCTPDGAAREIFALASGLVDGRRLLLSLGGEHAVSAPLVEAHLKRWPDLCVLQVDAHADMRSSYMGSAMNHACPMRRIMERGVHVTSVGVRSMDASERGFVDGPSSRIHLAHRVAGHLSEMAAEIVGALPSENVYLTIDLDGLDPSVVPAVGTPVPGGLGWYETLHLIRALTRNRTVIGADVVELAPRDGLHAADAAAARLVAKIIGYHATGRRR